MGLAPLHSILCTEELNTRPTRQPDYETENRALKSLGQALANSPRTILQTLADTILKVFKADSAGLSLLTKDGKRFYWPAIAGGWQPHIGGGTPREFGPCGDVLDCNAPLLFKHWERRYPYLVSATPPANEGLLVPFYVEGKAVGTIWAIAHTEHRKFDAEDLRQLESLGQFASWAYQAVASQEANVAKDMFLASLSHELRTPLSPVLLLAGEAITDPATSAANREVFATIVKNVKLEARLIDDLLDVTRISYGKLALDLQLVDLHAVIADAIETVRAELLEKNIVLTMELTPVRPFLRGDSVRLQQIFWNVLRNAGKFSPPGGEITVKSLILPNGFLCITIIDQGVGMTKAELARVFTSFSQGDHAAGGGSHRFGGLGLGLSISRMLVESHGGTIRAESGGLDQGATFIVEFPLNHEASIEQTVTASPAPPTLAASAAEGMPHRRILLVEDHKSTRIAMTNLLVRRQYEVVAVASLAEARMAVNGATFDLLISDLGLPDGSGNELMAELRARFGLKGIALTGYGNDEDVSRSRAAGFVAHLTKPVSIERLETALAIVAAA